MQSYKRFLSLFDDEWNFRLIIIDDGNLQNLEVGKKQVLSEINSVHWISYEQNMGKGHALRTGMSGKSQAKSTSSVAHRGTL